MSDSEKAEAPSLPWVKAANGVMDVYANMMHTTWTKDNVRIRLGQVINSPETPNPGPGFKGITEERAAVTLSWRFAKIARNELMRAVEKYENANGEIKLDVTLPESKP